ncbi:hypothetical protein BKA67DRAFT_664742 [Truncatella angustata]|uniref:histidine kinase n=1 Tax=Truncatella angustata TaxID=152316 RepID=A0A9P8UCF5_9PEZI|nr:uncharacterized protein BKA67DRAFT_664742 [Truncatella angustata]KAH6645727.1 hypothetical protein BKA67DRAFT_664742 [Truncatella angustata]
MLPPSDRLKGLMLDSLPAHVFVAWPTTGEIMWVNGRYLSYRGQTVADLILDPWGSVHPDDRDDYIQKWSHSFRTGEQFAYTVRLRRFDGVYRWHQTRAVASKDRRAIIVHFIGSYMDIHDQKVAELVAAQQEEIEASEAKHRLLANLIPQIIFAATEEHVITFTNEQWLSYTGQSFEDSLGVGFIDFVHPQDLAICRISSERSGSGSSFSLPSTDLSELVKKGIIKVVTDSTGRLSYTTEIRLKSKIGEYRWHLIRCVETNNINFGTGECSDFGSATDINDHKLLEDQLKEAMESKGRFLSSMSHEIRDTSDRHFGHDLSKVDAGMMKLNFEWFHTRSLIEDVNELVFTMATTKRLELNYVVEQDVPLWVKGDKARIRQVLLNVIGNAIKFTSQGEVFSRCMVTQRQEQGDHTMLEFSVVDTGRGFTKDQIDGSSTRQHGGSGLGLVIARQLVELHGGEMDGTAVPGKGSIFTSKILLAHAGDWAKYVGNQARVVVPSYGVVIHGVPTVSFDPAHQKEMATQLKTLNAGLIQHDKIAYMGWLTREGATKTISSIIVEFNTPEDKLIHAGCLWSNETHAVERYDRSCRIKQYLRCQKYDHITTQCAAESDICGYCGVTPPAATTLLDTSNIDFNFSGPNRSRRLRTTTHATAAARARRALRVSDSELDDELVIAAPRVNMAGDGPVPKKRKRRMDPDSTIHGLTPGKPSSAPGVTRPETTRRRTSSTRLSQRSISAAGSVMDEDSLVVLDLPDPNNNNTNNDNTPTLRILQILKYDVIAIQEPWINPLEYNSHNPMASTFTLWLPKPDTKPPGVAFYVNKRLDHSCVAVTSHTSNLATLAITYNTATTATDTSIDSAATLDSGTSNAPPNHATTPNATAHTAPHATAVTINATTPQPNTLYIHNIYNQPPDDKPASILQDLAAILQGKRGREQLIVGDFNMEGPEEFLETEALEVALPRGTIIREEGDSLSTIDLSTYNEAVATKLAECRRADELGHDSDHWPIQSTLIYCPSWLQHGQKINAVTVQSFRGMTKQITI